MLHEMKMIFIFIDGLGLGEKDKCKNPIFSAATPALDMIFNSFLVIPTDATLGVAGLPQSATGQTAIFTGINASKALNRHMQGQPTITLKNILNENNLFKELLNMGYKVTSSNVYRDEYLIKMQDSKDRRNRPSVSSVMSMSCGMKFRTISEYNQGQGIYHDITGKILFDNNFSEREITIKEAAERLYNISRDYDFTLFEHFLSDIVGHRMDLELAEMEIKLLDSFLGELLKLVDLSEDIIFIVSDHGNIEDISVKTHTFNKVPTIIGGRIPAGITSSIKSLTDITPAIIKIFKDTEVEKL